MLFRLRAESANDKPTSISAKHGKSFLDSSLRHYCLSDPYRELKGEQFPDSPAVAGYQCPPNCGINCISAAKTKAIRAERQHPGFSLYRPKSGKRNRLGNFSQSPDSLDQLYNSALPRCRPPQLGLWPRRCNPGGSNEVCGNDEQPIVLYPPTLTRKPNFAVGVMP